MSTGLVMAEQRQIIARIDTIIRELEALRRQLATPPRTVVTASITEELFGAAGQGTPDEYDLDLDWARFSQ